MNKIYISGRISGIDMNISKQNFKFSEGEVKKYHNADIVVNPFDNKPFLGINKWLFYIISDLITLSKCTHIAMRWDWIYSRGAVIEYFFARFIFKLNVIFLNNG